MSATLLQSPALSAPRFETTGRARTAGRVLTGIAVLWTGYFGGAVATHLRVDNPLLSHTLFPLYVAALVWGGLYLRDDRVRALLRRAR